MADARFLTAADALAGWRDDVLSGKPPTLYTVGTGELERVELGPGLVVLLGGCPGAGKSALAMQFIIDALRLTPTLRAVVCSVEMAPAVLLDRQLARLSGIDLRAIRYRQLAAEHADRIDQAMNTLDLFAERLAFVRPPFDLENVAATADAFGADLLLLDYVQRIRAPGDHGDRRGAVDKMMDYLRQFADAGVAVLCVAAVARTKDRNGRSSYAADGLNLASFKESGELEYGADSAYLLTPDSADGEGVTLRCLKDRNGEPRDIPLRFERRLQRFAPVDAGSTPRPDAGKLQSALASLWNRTRPAADDDQGEDD